MNRVMILVFISICFSVSARTDSNNLPQDIEHYYQAHNNIVCYTTVEERSLIRNQNEMPITLNDDPKRLAFIYAQFRILEKMTDDNKKKSMRVSSYRFRSIIPMEYIKIQKVSRKGFSKKSKMSCVFLKIDLYPLTNEENEQYITHFNSPAKEGNGQDISLNNNFFKYKSKTPVVSPKGHTPPQVHTWILKNGEWKNKGLFIQYLSSK